MNINIKRKCLLSMIIVSVFTVCVLYFSFITGRGKNSKRDIDTLSDGIFNFVINADGESATITGYIPEPEGVLIIPGLITEKGRSYPVTGIGDKAFMKNTRFSGRLAA